MRYFHLATIALTLRKLHVQDLLGSKLAIFSVYTFLPHPQVSSLFSILLLPFYPSLSRYTLLNFFQSYLPLFIFRLFYVSFFLSFDYSLSLSSLTPDDSSYCRTTPQPPYIRSHAMG